MTASITERITGTCRLTHDEDAERVARFQAGDSRAFDEIVAVHQQRIVRLAYRLIGWTDEVDDVTQDVFICVLRNLGRFDGRAKFSTWLTKIVVNQCRSHLRRRALRLRNLAKLVEHFTNQNDSANHETTKRSAELEQEEIRRAVSNLPAKYREPIVLRYFEQLSVREIGEVLGLAANTVDVRISRARRKLKESLGPRLDKEQT